MMTQAKIDYSQVLRILIKNEIDTTCTYQWQKKKEWNIDRVVANKKFTLSYTENMN